jgi:glutathione S-transferase
MSNPAYTVIGSANTRAGRVVWMLEELGLAYDYLAVKPHDLNVSRHNPSGKVPVLLVDGEPITESAAILTYLADRHGALTYRAGTLERARQDALLHCILDEFDAVLWAAARHSFILPEERRVPAVKDSLKWEFARNQASFVKRMGAGPYLMGAELTVPDLMLAHCVIWARSAKFEVTEPAILAHYAAVTSRPAFAALKARMKG